MSILLADDDVQLATFLSKSLESEGYLVHTALNENAAVAELRRQNYRLIILDLNLGQTDGLKLLEKLRAEGLKTPVIVLSARNKVSDRIESLNLGADDYVTKPFSFQELAARVQALLRRKADPALNILRVADLELDPATRKVSRGGREIKLSLKEFHLLHLLMKHAGNVVSRQELLRAVWGTPPEVDSNMVEVYITYLRKKIEHVAAAKRGASVREEDRLLHTIRGLGYRLGPDAAAARNLLSPPAARLRRRRRKSQNLVAGLADSSDLPQAPWRALVNSVVHDLTQPLTGIRCFLEMAVLRSHNSSSPPSDFKSVEQQADRAVALAKTISSLLRETPAPTGPWVSVDSLLDEVFADFAVVLESGWLTLERQSTISSQVTSNPLLRQLLVLLIGKLVGKSMRPLTLLAFAGVKGSRCCLELQWKASDGGAVQDGRTILGNDLRYIQEMVHSIGGELGFQGDMGIVLKLPAAPSQTLETVQ